MSCDCFGAAQDVSLRDVATAGVIQKEQNANQCHASKVLMAGDCNQGKED